MLFVRAVKASPVSVIGFVLLTLFYMVIALFSPVLCSGHPVLVASMNGGTNLERQRWKGRH